MESGKKVSGDIRSLGNAMTLQFECIRVLHNALLVIILLCGSEPMVWREKKTFTIRGLQMNME